MCLLMSVFFALFIDKPIQGNKSPEARFPTRYEIPLFNEKGYCFLIELVNQI